MVWETCSQQSTCTANISLHCKAFYFEINFFIGIFWIVVIHERDEMYRVCTVCLVVQSRERVVQCILQKAVYTVHLGMTGSLVQFDSISERVTTCWVSRVNICTDTPTVAKQVYICFPRLLSFSWIYIFLFKSSKWQVEQLSVRDQSLAIKWAVGLRVIKIVII